MYLAGMSSHAQPRLLVTGASGFLGWNVATFPQHDWEIVGLTGRHTVTLPGVRTVAGDLTDFAAIKACLAELRPQAVLHLAALADPNLCQTRPDESYRVNVAASVNLAGLCADAGIPCVFTSTDLVFDGRQAPYAESASPAPVSLYGEHKLLAEQEMRLRHPQLIVCRVPLMYGNPGPVARSFLQPLAAALREGREVRLFTDEFRTPVCARDAAAGLVLALRERVPLLHLGGPLRVSRFEFGALLAYCIGADRRLLVASRQADVTMPAPRPPDVSLDSTRAFALGYRPAAVAGALRALMTPLSR